MRNQYKGKLGVEDLHIEFGSCSQGHSANWYISNKNIKECRECKALKMRLYNKNYPPKSRFRPTTAKSKASQRASHRHLRMEVLLAYGGRCVCCNESRYEFLVFDHINGDGNKHRKEIGWRHTEMARWLQDHDYPQDFRVLCYNCNSSLGHYGYCAHEGYN